MKKVKQDRQLIVLEGCTITVVFDEHALHITNDKELERLLSGDIERVTDILVSVVQKEFRTLHHRDLAISADSLAVELWGHVYCGQLAQAIAELVPLPLVAQFRDKVISYCEVIDCGEMRHDNNRLFWDMLAAFKSGIAGWLPEQKRPEV